MPRILYVQYTNPAGYPPLEHSSRILADAGWQVLFLGTGAFGADCLTFPTHPNIHVTRMRYCSGGWRQKLHYLTYCGWVLWTTLIWRPRWIYASDMLSCPAALLASRLPGIRVVYHEHDSPAGKGEEGFGRLLRWARRKLARLAEVCVLPNRERLEKFVHEAGPVKSAACVWNCPSLHEIAPVSRSRAVDVVQVHYHGSLVPERIPLAVIDAVAMLPERVRLRITGYETTGSRGYVEEMKARAALLRIGDRVEFVPPVPSRSDLLLSARDTDIGLAMVPMSTGDENLQAMTGASNKAFDYLACGGAVLVSDLPDWRNMFVNPGYGLACNPTSRDSIASAIRYFVENPEQMWAMGEKGRQRILAEWNYETAFRPVLETLTDSHEGKTVSVPVPAS